jgi:hypothetical protein
VGEPDVYNKVFRGGEEKVTIRVEDNLGQGTLVALEEDRSLQGSLAMFEDSATIVYNLLEPCKFSVKVHLRHP